ncbi:Alpha-L-arabinofuranosidase 1 [Zea mays]|uniref:Alpha-L-arabinofuranosidase 1 n=1 Tax=Zea mays TaxID=4577 RepID=A0A1D6KTM8_MAIZE|nr:Alpha-L-arabinofuranosidase 1 [Zea mays]
MVSSPPPFGPFPCLTASQQWSKAKGFTGFTERALVAASATVVSAILVNPLDVAKRDLASSPLVAWVLAWIPVFVLLGMNCEEILLENVELTLEAFDYMQLPFTLKETECFMSFIMVLAETLCAQVFYKSIMAVISLRLLSLQEINHAAAGGIWAELVSNRGFEAGGLHTPSNIDPWSIIGDDSSVFVETDRTSCFSRNIIALRMEILCDNCPTGGVGVYNPGFWGMGHGFRTELISMILDLKPRFLRFSDVQREMKNVEKDIKVATKRSDMLSAKVRSV